MCHKPRSMFHQPHGMLRAGINQVNLMVEESLIHGKDVQMALHALAGALALRQAPLTLNGLKSGHGASLDFGLVEPSALAALAKTLQKLRVECHSFLPQRWDMLCSLRSLQSASLHLRPPAGVPLQQAPASIQSMQLTSLCTLQLCSVDLQPLMAQASALTALTRLHGVPARRFASGRAEPQAACHSQRLQLRPRHTAAVGAPLAAHAAGHVGQLPLGGSTAGATRRAPPAQADSVGQHTSERHDVLCEE